jgi:two-component system, chemotaxis family, protein-glutamate methylesterase/glutaminase
MTPDLVKVMVVDDSAVVRGMWARVLDAEADMRVVASAWTGRAALDVLRRREVDVVILDIEMPEMSGLEALPLILAEHPGVRVLMASSLTRRGAEVTVSALAMGAADYVTKPSAAERGAMADVGRDLVRKVRALGGRGARASGAGRALAAPPIRPRPPRPETSRNGQGPRAIAVTSSTGGPNALTLLLSALPADFPLPILIVQHMPALFTSMLAERLQRAASRPCVEAAEGMVVEGGRTYVAPGDYHMTARAEGGVTLLGLSQTPPENFCRPSADPLFRSLAAVYGSSLTAVVLTGMGHDGLEGAKAVVGAGGHVVVQDEATSVVWGMPGAVAQAGLAHEVLPLEAIAPAIDEQARARR